MIESELKIPVDSLDPIRRRLIENGADRVHEAELEVNTLLDTAQRSLAAARKVLRLRRVGERTVLTYKGPPSWSGAVKQRREIELEVASCRAMAELLSALGYEPWMRYEKRRESWRHNAVRVDLDDTPMGPFVEIEGPVEVLESAARSLGLDPQRAVAASYVSLWQERRRQQPDLSPDMVFEP